MKRTSKTAKRLTVEVIIIIVLILCLCLTTFALAYATLTVENNLFHTGVVQLNLNDGNPVIEEHEFLFEPGMTVEKTFFIQNESTSEVYYRLYFDHVEGGLSQVLNITILDGEQVLYSGTAASLTRENVGAADDVLGLGERRELTIRFHFPEESGNISQGLTLSFDLCADAVQTRNNPNKLFD